MVKLMQPPWVRFLLALLVMSEMLNQVKALLEIKLYLGRSLFEACALSVRCNHRIQQSLFFVRNQMLWRGMKIFHSSIILKQPWASLPGGFEGRVESQVKEFTKKQEQVT